ncbi:unnamed protein product [Urochloa decumbens]|uniref:FAD-binding domain-containing protein n=1 Tax=Urochloa decumbens TaxID=240449 RepID=A0ABC8VBI7_9POAL
MLVIFSGLQQQLGGDMEEEVHGIVIVGGGICGLATALALHQKGIPSLVLEKSETLRADGGSIGVHVNGWRVLEQLGIASDLRETAGVVTEFHDVWQQEQGNKSVVVPVRGELRWLKRKDLIETMAKNIPSGSIRFSCHIAAIRPADPGNHGAVLTTLDGSIVRAKALIGCDAFWHPGGDATKDAHAMKDFLLEKLQGQCSDEILEMVRDPEPDSLIILTKIWYRPPWQVMFSSFQRGTVTVAGDAMHVMGTYIGQGGSAGLEDALVLARSLSRATAGSDGSELCEKKIGTAIKEYVKERRLRVVRLSLESFAMGTLLATKSLLAKLASFAIVSLLGTGTLRHTNYDCGRL